MKRIMDTKLPEVYQRSGKDCYLDPVRNKLIYVTPEETVRQHIISYLINDLKVPANMIRVEERLSHYGVDQKRRADIIVEKYDAEQNASVPLAVIECKAPGVFLGEKAQNQVLDYTDALGCDYAMVSDGETSFFYKYNEKEDNYTLIEDLPAYVDMIRQKFVPLDIGSVPERIPFDEIPERELEYAEYDIGKDTDKNKREAMVNFLETLLSPGSQLPCKQYKLFRVIKDYGVRILEYGNNGGGAFNGPYRSFLIEYEGSTEFVSIAVSAYVTDANPMIERTSINVAIDNEKTTHHSLQLVVDDNMQMVGNVCSFYHHGRIGVGSIGSGKISELRQFVENEMPELISGNRFYLGKLVNDRLWRLDDEDFGKLVENLISYALIRDKYREWLKNNKR